MDKKQEAGQSGLSQPAAAQALAIEHASGPIQVLAGPGSGKTYLTIRRIRHLICHHGISPNKILVITFTKAAAQEMEERFHNLTDKQYEGVSFGTFHAIYYHIWKSSGYGGGKFTIATAQEKRNCINHVLCMHGITNAEPELAGILLKEISNKKNNVSNERGLPSSIDDDGLSNDTLCGSDMASLFPTLFQEYCGLMEEMGKLDFDDMIFLCSRMFAQRPQILTYWQSIFSHILVDEFQDISPLQYQVLKQLAAPENNLFTVGDDDQSIYGFRGAGPDIMRQFLMDYPNAAQLTLDVNYRSAVHIVEASLLLIANNKNRFIKEIKAYRQEKGHVTLYAFQEKEEEERHLIHQLKEMSPKEQEHAAIICRTNIQLSGFSRLLAREGIRFVSKERVENLYLSDIAKDFLAYLQFASDTYGGKQSSVTQRENPPREAIQDAIRQRAISNKDNVAPESAGLRQDFLRIMNHPCRYIQRSSLDSGDCSQTALLDYYRHKPYMQERLKALFADLKRIALLRPYLAVDYIRKKIGYDAWLCEGKGTETKAKLLETADEIQQAAAGHRTFSEWLREIAVYSQRLEENARGKTRVEEGVQLVTMHGSKGLEYDTVFLPRVSAGMLPSRRAHTKEALEEERRIFYVAMTRAKFRLEISYAKEPSPFLAKWTDSPCVEKKESGSG